MNHAVLMCMLHGIADLAEQLQPGGNTERRGWIVIAVGVREQVAPANVLHGEVCLPGRAVARDAGLENLGDAGMLQPAKYLRFVFESPQGVG